MFQMDSNSITNLYHEADFSCKSKFLNGAYVSVQFTAPTDAETWSRFCDMKHHRKENKNNNKKKTGKRT